MRRPAAWFLAASVLAVFIAAHAHGQALNGPLVETPLEGDLADEDTVKGVIVDQTITHFGRDFAVFFGMSWRDQPGYEKYTLTVRERPSARWGSRIWIEQNNRVIYSTWLRPQRANIKATAERAAGQVAQRLTDEELGRVFAREPDLGPSEL